MLSRSWTAGTPDSQVSRQPLAAYLVARSHQGRSLQPPRTRALSSLLCGCGTARFPPWRTTLPFPPPPPPPPAPPGPPGTLRRSACPLPLRLGWVGWDLEKGLERGGKGKVQKKQGDPEFPPGPTPSTLRPANRHGRRSFALEPLGRGAPWGGGGLRHGSSDGTG